MTTRAGADTLRDAFLPYAFREGDAPCIAPIPEILRGHALVPLGAGVFHRVLRIEGTPWVLKEARWRLALPLRFGMELPLPGRSLHALLSRFGSGCLPTVDEFRRRQSHYHAVAAALGWWEATHPPVSGIAALIREQAAFRSSLLRDLPSFATRHGLASTKRLADVLSGANGNHNFLPEEYATMGVCLHDSARTTSYVLQRYVDGASLHDSDIEKHRDALTLFCALSLRLCDTSGLLPDTRPRILLHPDWLTRTDNILCSGAGPMLVDTRWCWEARRNWLCRGGPIPPWTIRSYRSWLARHGA